MNLDPLTLWSLRLESWLSIALALSTLYMTRMWYKDRAKETVKNIQAEIKKVL